MSEIEKALKTEEEDFHISNDERLMLIDILIFVAAALKSGKLWFNEKGIEKNANYIWFCEMIAKKFANMPVEKQH